MKAKKSELDVDVIGGEGPLTNEEEKALSEFFKQRKSETKPRAKKQLKPLKRAKITA